MKRHRISIKGSLLLKLLKHHLVELDPMKFGDCVNAIKSIFSTEDDMEVVGVDFNISDDTVHLRCFSAGQPDPWIGETRSFVDCEEQLGWGARSAAEMGRLIPAGFSLGVSLLRHRASARRRSSEY